MKNRRILKGASTYLDVDQKPKPMESDVELKNNQAPMNLLIDPDEDFDQIDTHFPIIAGKKKQILSDLVDDAGVEEVPAVEDAPVSDAPVDAPIEAADEAPVEDIEIAEEPDLEEVQANEEAAQNAAEMLSPDSEEEVVGCDTRADAPTLASAKKVKASEEVALPDQGTPSEITVDDAVDVVDIDAMPDDDVEAVDFVEMPDATVAALKANRVIATLTKKAAIVASIEKVYTQPQFEAAVRLEMKKHGLRAGLKNCGFTLSSFKIKANQAVALQVSAATKKMAASAAKFKEEQQKAMIQATAIACLGLNRGIFKGHKNELRAELVKNLKQAGLVNAERVVQAAFASKGVEYLKTVLALASKIQAMPEEVRDGYVEQLDMTEEPEITADSDAETFGDPMENDDVMVEVQEDPMPETVQAAVIKPIRQLKASAQVSSALDLLKNREAPMPFGLNSL